MQQRGQPEPQIPLEPVLLLQRDGLVEHGQRVPVHVLMPMMLVHLEPHHRHLGQICSATPVRTSRSMPADGPPGLLARSSFSSSTAIRSAETIVQPRREFGHRVRDLLGRRQAKLRDEARGPQDPQRVVAERVDRAARRPQDPVPQVGEPAERIDQVQARQLGSHRVDGEVAPGQVGAERGLVLHVRLAGVGLVVLAAVGRDLEVVAALAQSHGAELHADRPGCVRPVLGYLQHLLGPRIRGQVEVSVRPAEERVAYRTPDKR